MLARINIYLKEMYPVIPRLFVAIIYFFQLYFILLLNTGISNFRLGIQEGTGILTIFSFLLSLRIADDLKDYETDSRLFPERALPSGRVKKRDLYNLLAFTVITTVSMNYIFMNNFLWFLFLAIYGTLMSLWFFQREKIQNSLPLALLTHNPVVMILNAYILSFVCYKYDLPLVSWQTFLLLISLYFPSLIWEISRKIRAPREETEYVTYSILFGYKKVTRFVYSVAVLDMAVNLILIWNISRVGSIALMALVAWLTIQTTIYINNPDRFKIKNRVELYILLTEATIVLSVLAHIIME